jgi:hypothetical protein
VTATFQPSHQEVKRSGFLVQADQPAELVSHLVKFVRGLPKSVDKLNNKQANLQAQREAEEVLARLEAGDPSLHVHAHGHGGGTASPQAQRSRSMARSLSCGEASHGGGGGVRQAWVLRLATLMAIRIRTRIRIPTGTTTITTMTMITSCGVCNEDELNSWVLWPCAELFLGVHKVRWVYAHKQAPKQKRRDKK